MPCPRGIASIQQNLYWWGRIPSVPVWKMKEMKYLLTLPFPWLPTKGYSKAQQTKFPPDINAWTQNGLLLKLFQRKLRVWHFFQNFKFKACSWNENSYCKQRCWSVVIMEEGRACSSFHMIHSSHLIHLASRRWFIDVLSLHAPPLFPGGEGINCFIQR